MKKLLLVFLSVLMIASCKKEPKEDLSQKIKVTIKSDYGSIYITRDGIELKRTEIRGVYEEYFLNTPGYYEFYLTSVPPGFSYIYVDHNGKRVVTVERSHTNRVDLKGTYTYP